MVTELAILSVRPGASTAFEASFANIAPLLVEATGSGKHRPVAVINRADVYFLEVEWRNRAALTPFPGAESCIIHVPGSVPS